MKEIYPKVKKSFFLHPDDGAIPYLNNRLKKMLADAGIEMLGDTIAFSNETVDFGPIAAKVVERKADAVYFINGIAQHFGSLLKLLRSGGWNKPFCGCALIAPEEIRAVAGKPALTDFFSGGFIPGNPSNPPAMEAVIKKLSKPGKERAFHLLTGWRCRPVLCYPGRAEADPTVVKNHWETINTIPETLFGPGKVGGKE